MIRILLVSVLLLAAAARLAFSDPAIDDFAAGDSAIASCETHCGIAGSEVDIASQSPSRAPAVASAFGALAISSGNETDTRDVLGASRTDAVLLLIFQKQEDPFPIGMIDSFFVKEIAIELFASGMASPLP